MRFLWGSALVPVLLLLLSWLYFQGSDPDASHYDHAMVTLDKFRMAEGALRQNIADARSGLLRDYDDIDIEMEALEDSLRHLPEDKVESAVLRPLETLVGQQEILTERFKTDNALLQNALAYFGLLTGRFGFEAENSTLNSAIAALAASMIHLMLDTTKTSAAEVQAGLDHLASLQNAGGNADLVTGILVHGRALRDLLPATDDTLRLLYNLPIEYQIALVRESILAHQRRSLQTARGYRELLYAVSILLIVLIIALGFQLRRSLLALRRRAAFEHAIASISMRFVNARPEEMQAVIEQTLAELADWIGADRAYLVVASAPPKLYWWSRDDNKWPASWPFQASSLARRIVGTEDKIVYLPSIDVLKAKPERSLLAEAGLLGWACIPAKGQNETRCLLGFDALKRPMIWPAGELGLLHMAADTITNAVGRSELESERARLQASLDKGRRMEIVGALTSGVAHNFNNIIAAILGHTEMQEAEVVAESRMARHVAGVRLAAERARDLVEQLLNFGRRRAPPQQQIPLRTLITETESLLSASLPGDVQLSVQEVPLTAIVRGDPTQLQQVIINLCNNAAQAMDRPGAVELTTDMQTITASTRLSHGQLLPGPYVRIAVRDNGRGMDATTLEHLFEPFFTTRPDGNGLGLATVHEIVGSHGGAINVTSRIDEGSLFEVWLPAISASGQSATPDGVLAAGGNGESVLIIDDNKARLLHDEELVAALGYEPVGFTETDVMLAAFRSMPQRFDIVLIAHIAPLSRALAVAGDLHRISPEIPILLAALADELGADVLARVGVREVLSMPLISSELALAFRRWLPNGSMPTAPQA